MQLKQPINFHATSWTSYNSNQLTQPTHFHRILNCLRLKTNALHLIPRTQHTTKSAHTQSHNYFFFYFQPPNLTGTTAFPLFQGGTPLLSFPPSLVSDDTLGATNFSDAASLAIEAVAGPVPRIGTCCTVPELPKEPGEDVGLGQGGLETVAPVLELGKAVEPALPLTSAAVSTGVFPRGTCPQTCCTTLRTSSIFMGLRRTTSAPSCMHTTSKNGVYIRIWHCGRLEKEGAGGQRHVSKLHRLLEMFKVCVRSIRIYLVLRGTIVSRTKYC